MASRGHRVHVVTTSRRYKGQVYRTHLLRHNVCRRKQSPDNEPTFTMVTTANAQQQRALDLLEAITL